MKSRTIFKLIQLIGMITWMSVSLINDLHLWGPWWWSGWLCPWPLTCIYEVPDDDLDVYAPDHWPALMRSLMMIWMSMSLMNNLHWWGPWWWFGCPWLLTTVLHWWSPWWWSGCLCPWSITCIDEIPDDDLDVYVSDHWPALMRSLMMIWMSMSLITDLHWWGPWLWSGCLCPWSLTCIDKLPDDDLDVYVWSLTCIDEVPDYDLDVYVPDHWPALISSLMMIWMSMSDHWPALMRSLMMIWMSMSDHWPVLMRSLIMIWMSMSLITDLHWWGPWWWSGWLCPWSLTCIDEVPDDDLDVSVSDHWPALMRSLMMIWISMSLITDLHWWGPWLWSGCLCPWSLTCIDEVPDYDLDVYVPDHWPALVRSLMMIWISMSLITDLHNEVPDDDLDIYVPDHWPALARSLMMIWMSLITDLHWWGPWWWSGCLCPWSLTCIDEVPDDDLDVYVPDHWPA